MAITGLSEFMFGYGFLYEQTHIHWGELIAAPVLPSLQAEQALGWDAHIPLQGVDFYYQFKLSDYLSRSNAQFISDGTYYSAYFRISLHRKNGNQQHRRLRNHAIDSTHTYYVAPEFSTLDEFNQSFLGHSISTHSRLIPLSDCDDIYDSDQHYLIYQPDVAGFIQLSEPKRHERSYFGRELDRVYRESIGSWQPLDRPYAERLFEKTREAVRRQIEEEDWRTVEAAVPLLNFQTAAATRGDLLLRTAEVLATVVGVTLVLVGNNE
jgi:hypothetical protein